MAMNYEKKIIDEIKLHAVITISAPLFFAETHCTRIPTFRRLHKIEVMYLIVICPPNHYRVGFP